MGVQGMECAGDRSRVAIRRAVNALVRIDWIGVVRFDDFVNAAEGVKLALTSASSLPEAAST